MSDAPGSADQPVGLVLRLSRAALADGRLAGCAEVIATGERVPLRHAGDVLAIAQRHAGLGTAGGAAPSG